MKCLHCQGELRPGAAPLHIDRPGVHLQLDSVPALVCAQCGEPFFEKREVESIQAILTAVDDHTATTTPVHG